MNDENAPSLENDAEPVELPAIEFQSPGRFTVHNPQTALPEAERREPAPFILGSHQPMERFSQPADARAHALALLQQAQRRLCLYSADLEPWLYHHSSVQEACTHFLLAHPKNRLRILLRDPTRAVKEGHRLLQLARRLPSNLQIRKLHPSYPSEEIAFLLADGNGLLLRPELDQYAGYALYHDPARVRLRQTQFDQAWDTSITDPDLRSFLL
ncbi:histone acetyltransferase HPA2 [Pseudomonas cavernicola]|uniref:Histone acetyltransferase HPA2 n=1 Tax=Pseudomonas cavernicola TaxID=2320866 RepID=A0A418XQ51_9PSED|nr:histone acetyltransferase HPA2 [Pseudomonas cavernicola]RJG14609.1 histone acetyltransferase HPA2 [Pseudomonas cavernicola]